MTFRRWAAAPAFLALLCALLPLPPGIARAADARPSAPLQLKPCRLEHPLKVSAREAECGTLRVPENYAAPNGRKISLFVARVPAVSQRTKLDPLFVIAGGPGMASSSFYASVSSAFERTRRERDILLVDQRGTGRSNALDCEFDDTDIADASAERVVALTRTCADELRQSADLRHYTTSVAIRDLDAVRAALDYTRVSVYGVSYGSRVAQHYARRFPNNTRALILDGVLHPGLVLGPAMALDAEAALARILTRCTADAACRKAFGDPGADYRALRTRLAEKPVPVNVPDPTTGKATAFAFARAHLSAVLRLSSYSPEQAALLPLALQLANRDGNFGPLASQFLMITRSLDDSFAYGMHNSVVCAEDVPLIDDAKLQRTALAATHMGATQVDQLRAMCSVWDRGEVDEDFHQPLMSSAAALLLSGSDDPVTPPAYADVAARAFADQKHLTLPGFGHGQLTTPCVDRIIEAFLKTGTTRDLDTACTKALKPVPFFLSPAGPAP